jgi:hypothetical protein
VGLWLVHHLRFRHWHNRIQQQRFTRLKRSVPKRQPNRFRHLDP